ncbi:hypothetical protein [Sedimentitalea todarodis]|uniref:Uncharacterized protein n=1 Tax=Sedimentitalea todarodis TaxID=1631240 RepID=A0ABU3V865_9RHOB|nr:hypothetical protein [Sedimentitalea todarodis]MDU9002357.1 hypothetical protein [Sedimentitalea todarodis]
MAGQLATAAPAQTPEDIIRWVYQSHTQTGPQSGIHHLASPAQRAQFFSRRMVAFFEANDSYGNDLASACLDFALDIPGNDFDAQEIARTLSVSSTGDAEQTSVTASFTTFGQPAQIIYDFISEGGFMRIDDIAGPGWRVSLMPCAPKPAASASPAPASGGYCYMSGDDTLRLDLHGDSGASFDLISWQANGHTCGARGLARAVDGGWLYESSEFGSACRLGIMVAPDGGIRLSDPDHRCKQGHCGQRAVIDGLQFARSTQIDCAQMPRH